MHEPRTYRPSAEPTVTVNISTTAALRQWLRDRAAGMGVTVSYLATQIWEAERKRKQEIEESEKAA